MAKKRYYKLGINANSFSCSQTKLKLVPGLPGVIDKKPSKTIEKAVSGGHIIPITEEEFNRLAETYTTNTGIDIRPGGSSVEEKRINKPLNAGELGLKTGAEDDDDDKDDDDKDDDDKDDDDGEKETKKGKKAKKEKGN